MSSKIDEMMDERYGVEPTKRITLEDKIGLGKINGSKLSPHINKLLSDKYKLEVDVNKDPAFTINVLGFLCLQHDKQIEDLKEDLRFLKAQLDMDPET